MPDEIIGSFFTKKKVNCVRLQGADTLGNVFDFGNFVVREESSDHPGTSAMMLQRYLKNDLVSLGVVETEAMPGEPTLLRHKKYLVTYPHEWTASMYKDAVLFHLHLLERLEEKGLTLKDGLPENILFEGTKPVFIDFFSLLTPEELTKEKCFTDFPEKDLRIAVLRIMFLPYMLIPLICHAIGNHELARIMLGELFCNSMMWRPPQWTDIPNIHRYQLLRLKFEKLALGFEGMPWKRRIRELSRAVEELPVIPRQSDYLSYYEEKGESFSLQPNSAWKDKQQSVYECLKRLKPSSVLDLGANTGWFSRLAASMGIKVIAIDNDESCIDTLYRQAKKENLPITPLFLEFNKLQEERFGKLEEGIRTAMPIHSAALKRLPCDMVFCLGLFHHLTLGLGHQPEEILQILAQLTRTTLILEFVDLNDPKIAENEDSKTFFTHKHEFSSDTYNLETIMKLAQHYFSQIEMLPSEKTRHILLLQK